MSQTKDAYQIEVVRADGNPYTYTVGAAWNYPATKFITRISWESVYHGDHDQIWLVVYVDGEEAARFNTRSADTRAVIWAQP